MSEPERPGPLHVVATAGHVDHGKSRLLERLTGMDPDRLAEEKRRGLTIDLGYAWFTLPSGREVGFVDVPGHERFVRNMLAGVGPVRLVLFVVAADEGWKPQSEEHLQILDVLGVDGAVVGLTKSDLVDDETLGLAREEVRERTAGTALERASIVACSSTTGAGLDRLIDALDAMVADAPAPERDGRPRLHVDRVFTIAGSGTVVTGTLTGASLRVGEEVAVLPGGVRARVRGLQTHKRRLDEASPVSRVAVNLAGVERGRVRRGDVVVEPGRWRPTSVFEASLTPVRGLERELSGRGAYKLYAGAAERDARVRVLGSGTVPPGGRGFARIRTGEPLVLAAGDRFVLREAGRAQTVAGGTVLEPDPPRRPGADAEERLARRETATVGGTSVPASLAQLVVAERGVIHGDDLRTSLAHVPERIAGATRVGPWWFSDAWYARAEHAGVDAASAHHRSHPLDAGADASAVRAAIAAMLPSRAWGAAGDVLDALVARGALTREGSAVRLPSHRPAVAERRADVDRVVEAVAGAEPTPPSIPQLVAAGHARAIVETAIREGALVRVAADVVFTRRFVDRAVAEVAAAGAAGITVSALRERLGTSRKFVVPLLEHLDQRGLTLRRGDVRVARQPAG
jgi:selenocysteine-specific elongation factor